MNNKYKRNIEEILDLYNQGYSQRQVCKIMTDKYESRYDQSSLSRELQGHPDYKPLNEFKGGDNTEGRKPLPKDLANKLERQNKIEGQMETQGLTEGVNATWKIGWLKDKDGNSILVKNISEVVSLDDMLEEFTETMKEYSPELISIKRKPLLDPHLLVIDIADLHIGKLADPLETNDEYNNEIAIERALAGVDGILNKASGFPIDKILFVIGNDVLHTDGASPSTTSGTPQDMTKKWHRNFTEARDMYVQAIDKLRVLADVHIVHNPSNHDFVSGFMLANVIHAWFRNCDNITFDITNNHRKYFRYGNSLIGTSHGDGAKIDQLPLIMANEAKHDWADTYWRYIYLHHVHHKDYFKFRSGKDYQGCTVEYLRSPSGTDAWHQKAGFTLAPKAIEGFVHSFEHGQVARLTHLFK